MQPTTPPLSTLRDPIALHLGLRHTTSENALSYPRSTSLYHAATLTTHGVDVGMTGSGQDRPVHQPPRRSRHRRHPRRHHRPQGRSYESASGNSRTLIQKHHQEWLNEDDAAASTFARAVRQGIVRSTGEGPARFGPDAGRIAHLKASSDQRIYTPGSEAGLPLSILGAFAAPKIKLNHART